MPSRIKFWDWVVSKWEQYLQNYVTIEEKLQENLGYRFYIHIEQTDDNNAVFAIRWIRGLYNEEFVMNKPTPHNTYDIRTFVRAELLRKLSAKEYVHPDLIEQVNGWVNWYRYLE